MPCANLAGSGLFTKGAVGLWLGVEPDLRSAALTRRAAPPRLRFGGAAGGAAWVTACAAQAAKSCAPLARPALGWRLRIQPQVGEDLLEDWPLDDGRDDLQFPAAAVRAVLHVDVKDALEQARPADAVRLAGPVLPRHRASQRQHLLPGARAEGDAVGDGRGLQRPAGGA